MSSYIKTENIKLVRLAKEMNTFEDKKVLNKKINKQKEGITKKEKEIIKYTSNVNAYSLIKRVCICLCIISVVSFLFSIVLTIIFKRNIVLYTILSITISFVLMVCSIMFSKKIAFFKRKIDDLNKEIECDKKAIIEYESNSKKYKSKDDFNKEIVKIEKSGRDFFEAYSSSGGIDDLESSAKCGNPAAIVYLISKHYLSSELSAANSYNGLSAFTRGRIVPYVGYKTNIDAPSFVSSETLISWLFEISKDNYFKKYTAKGFYCPFEAEYQEYYDSISYLHDLFIITRYHGDSEYAERCFRNEDPTNTFKCSIIKTINSGKLAPCLHQSAKSFGQFSSATVLSDTDLKRISDKVNEQFNPTVKPTDVEWVYVPDVSDM